MQNHVSDLYAIHRKTGLGLNALEYFEKESMHHLRTFYLAESFDEPGGKGTFQMRHSFPYFFLLVHISETFVRKFIIHLHTVYASSQKLATTGMWQVGRGHPFFLPIPFPHWEELSRLWKLPLTQISNQLTTLYEPNSQIYLCLMACPLIFDLSGPASQMSSDSGHKPGTMIIISH